MASQRNLFERMLSDAAALWTFHSVYSALVRSDVLVCLGSYDLRVANRCAQLLHEGLAPLAITTGSFGNWTRNKFPRPEAELFADAMVALGIDRERILIENRATNIGENIAFSRSLLSGKAIERVIFVTKPQTQRRVLATIPKQWPGIEGAVTAPLLELLAQANNERGLPSLIDEMVGDLERILEYPTLGFQEPVEVPAAVLSSYRRLRKCGFDGHCIADVRRSAL